MEGFISPSHILSFLQGSAEGLLLSMDHSPTLGHNTFLSLNVYSWPSLNLFNPHRQHLTIHRLLMVSNCVILCIALVNYF